METTRPQSAETRCALDLVAPALARYETRVARAIAEGVIGGVVHMMMASPSVMAVSKAPPVLDHGPTAENAAAPIRWPPAVAARFQQPKFLGKGMFGRVYAAWDTVTEQLVAVKQLSGRTSGDVVATGPVEFAQEVSALEACRGHPNVVKLVDTVDADADSNGDRFIVTEYAGRLNLKRYMQQRRLEGRPFTEAEVRDAMRQITTGVACAHRAAVVHREIVPENVVVYDVDLEEKDETTTERKKKKAGCVKYRICGFNASERAGGADAKDGSSQCVSSTPYRAPEVFLSPTEYDERIDVWGLGCIMAELLSDRAGVPFFSRASEKQVLPGILKIVGAKGLVEWSGLERVVAPEQASKLRERYGQDAGMLGEVFPKKVLCQQGLDVLRGLLHSNPDRRLTAEAALAMPWFRGRVVMGACLALPVTRACCYFRSIRSF